MDKNLIRKTIKKVQQVQNPELANHEELMEINDNLGLLSSAIKNDLSAISAQLGKTNENLGDDVYKYKLIEASVIDLKNTIEGKAYTQDDISIKEGKEIVETINKVIKTLEDKDKQTEFIKLINGLRDIRTLIENFSFPESYPLPKEQFSSLIKEVKKSDSKDVVDAVKKLKTGLATEKGQTKIVDAVKNIKLASTIIANSRGIGSLVFTEGIETLNTPLQSIAGFNIPAFTVIEATYPTTASEVYTYKNGATTVGVITVVFSDATKTVLTSVTKT